MIDKFLSDFSRASGRFGLWCGKRRTCDAGEFAEPVGFFQLVSRYRDVGFCVRVGCSHLQIAGKAQALRRRLDKQSVVADQREELAVAVDAIFAKHLAGGYVACARQNVRDVIGGGGLRRHRA